MGSKETHLLMLLFPINRMLQYLFFGVIVEGKELEQTVSIVNQTALDIAKCPVLTGGLEPI